jgi:hypothetical protein
VVPADRHLDAVRLLIARPQFDAKLKAALQRLADMQAQLAALKTQMTEKETRIKEIEAEQERNRPNMRELDRQGELYKQHVDEPSKQEGGFDKLREDTWHLRSQEADQTKVIADHLKGLDVWRRDR